jgi:hypothetical protein
MDGKQHLYRTSLPCRELVLLVGYGTASTEELTYSKHSQWRAGNKLIPGFRLAPAPLSELAPPKLKS